MAAEEMILADDFIGELEKLRRGHRREFPFRARESGKTKQEVSEAKRRNHLGGPDNHKFEGERYLNCTVREVRRKQLRKLVDEGGLTTFGGKVPSHPALDRLGSREFGLNDAEILRLEKEDPMPEKLILRGWWVNLNRTKHWAIAIGSGMVVEGEKKVDPESEAKEIEEMKKDYSAMGVKNIGNAVWFRAEHAGVDMDHADFNEMVVKQHVDTPELREEMRRAFILRLQNQGF